jgi:tetratricopeptide (TPR) repeat protein
MEKDPELVVTPIEELRKAWEADPANRDAGIQLAQACTDCGWYNQAIDIYKRIIDEKETGYALLLDYGNVCYRHGDGEEALRLFKKLTELRPGRIEGWNNLGIVLLAAGKRDEAGSAFAHVLEIEPENPGALVNLASCHSGNGNVDAAIELLEKAVHARRDFADAWFNLGNARSAKKEYEPAIDAFKRALRYQPEMASAYKNLGYVHEQLGDFDEALKQYQQCMALNKADAGAYINMANVYIKQGKLDTAKKQYLHAVRLAPREPSGWMGLRHLALMRGDLTTYVRSTVAIMHRLGADAAAESVTVLRELKHFDKADEVLHMADSLNLTSDHLDSERLLSLQRRTIDHAKMAALYQHLALLENASDNVKEALAAYHSAAKEYDAALEWIEKVRDKSMAGQRLWWEILFHRQAWDRAIDAITAYLDEHPDNFDGHFFLAKIAAAQEKTDAAREHLVQALKHGFSDVPLIEEDAALSAVYHSLGKET